MITLSFLLSFKGILYVISTVLEKAMATHSSTLAWKIPWTEEPGGLQSMGSQRVRHDWATLLSLFPFMIGEGNGNPLQCSCLENPRDGRAWWATVCGVAQSLTRLKWLSSSSSTVLYLWQVFVFLPPVCLLFTHKKAFSTLRLLKQSSNKVTLLFY